MTIDVSRGVSGEVLRIFCHLCGIALLYIVAAASEFSKAKCVTKYKS